MPRGKHPKHLDVYTPFTPEVYELIMKMKAEYGTWRAVCAISHTKAKVLRSVREGKRKAVSYTLLDRLCSTTGVGGVQEFVWFTADDLVLLGIWEEHAVLEGLDIIHKGEVKQHGLKYRNTQKTRRLKAKAKKRELARINRKRRSIGLPEITKRYYGPYS